MNYSYVVCVPGVYTMDHHYNNRIVKELKECNTDYNDIVFDLELINDLSTEWMVTLTNGVQLELSISHHFPFYCPFVKLVNFDDPHGLIACECESSWHCGSRISKLLVIVYMKTQAIFEARRRRLCLMGLLRTIPMMMLWRKRATERVYHPSRIDFAAELRELNALLF